MFPSNKPGLFKPFLLIMAVILGFSGILFAAQPAAAQGQFALGMRQILFQTIPTLTPTGSPTQTLAPGQLFDLNQLQAQQNPYQNCGLLYAIQPNDTLSSIATTFGVTGNDLMNQNYFLDQNHLIPGMVICIAPVPSGVIPSTGESVVPGVNVVSVNPGQTVTVQGVNFRSGAQVISQMLEYASQNVNTYPVSSFIVPSGGSFQVQLSIPSQLQSSQLIRVRFVEQSTGQSASTVFRNYSPAGGGIPANLCTEFYTVRQGDRLVNIARQFGTTYSNLAEINNIANPNLIYPGQRLCVGTSLQIPSTGGYNPALTIVRVSDDVTVSGADFPGGNTFRVFIGVRGTSDVQPVQTADYTTPQDGSFQTLFNIPKSLLKHKDLYIRFEQINGPLVAVANFTNNLAQYGGNTPTPPSSPAATSTPLPTLAPTNLPTLQPTAQSTQQPTLQPTQLPTEQSTPTSTSM